MKTKSFTVGGHEFQANRHQHPIPHWRVQTPSGEEWSPGTAGISTESVPKMKADLEYLLSKIGEERFAQSL